MLRGRMLGYSHERVMESSKKYTGTRVWERHFRGK